MVHRHQRRYHLLDLLFAVVGQLDGVVAVIVGVEDAEDHGGDLHAVFGFEDVLVEALLQLVVVVAGVVQVGENGEAAADAVLLGVAVDDEVLAALPIDHHEVAAGLAEERIHGARDAVLRQRDDLLRIVECEAAPENLLLVELAEEPELLEVLLVRLPFQEVLDLLVHEGAALGGLQHLADNLFARLSRVGHELLDIRLLVEIGEELLDEGGHGGVVGRSALIAFVGVGVRGLVEDHDGVTARCRAARPFPYPLAQGRQMVGLPERLDAQIFLANKVAFLGRGLLEGPAGLRRHGTSHVRRLTLQSARDPAEQLHAGVRLLAHLPFGEAHHRPAAVVEPAVAHGILALDLMHRHAVPAVVGRVDLHIDVEAGRFIDQCDGGFVGDGTAGSFQMHVTAQERT